jgi:hypothetical protein
VKAAASNLCLSCNWKKANGIIVAESGNCKLESRFFDVGAKISRIFGIVAGSNQRKVTTKIHENNIIE